MPERCFDLLGDPIPEGRGKVGPTGHIATDKNINKIMILVLFGWRKPEIAAEMRITVPTLNKHYFS